MGGFEGDCEARRLREAEGEVAFVGGCRMGDLPGVLELSTYKTRQ